MALKSGRVGIHPSQVDPITGMLLNVPTPGSISFEDLSDAQIANPEVGQTLIYNGTGWENETPSVTPTTLAALQDVEITDVEDGDFLVYDAESSKWINTGEAPGPSIIQKQITVYSAVEDIISYVDIYGATQTEAFSTNSDHKTITVDIYPEGSSIIFTSGVAKDPSNLSSAYTKTITITDLSGDVYIMPDNTLYWYGYVDTNFETCSSDNGWSVVTGHTLGNVTYNKNSINLPEGPGVARGVGNKNPLSITKLHSICECIFDAYSGDTNYVYVNASSIKSLDGNKLVTNSALNTIEHLQISTTNPYISVYTIDRRAGNVFGIWYE